MKRREITVTGTVNNDGRLAMYMGELNEFFKEWKNCKVIAKFSIVTSRCSDPLRAYYFKYVLPTFRQAIWESGERLTLEQTELRLREYSPIVRVEDFDPETGECSYELREIIDLSNAELIEHIEFLKQLAAEEFCTYIEDPENYSR